MTNETTARACEMRGCTETATKHLTFQENGEADAQGTIKAPMKHIDYCDEHVQGALEHYGGGAEDIDKPCYECPTVKKRQ